MPYVKHRVGFVVVALILATGVAILEAVSRSASGSPPCGVWESVQHPLHWHHSGQCDPYGNHQPYSTMEGSWYWMRAPEQERRVVMNLYNRYCIRCHGVDGRGVWDIPDVPDFTNPVWQASRGDDQLVRLTLEGRGAVMPAFRGTVTLEEAWGMARYLRTFVPGTEISPPEGWPPQSVVPPTANGSQANGMRGQSAGRPASSRQ